MKVVCSKKRGCSCARLAGAEFPSRKRRHRYLVVISDALVQCSKDALLVISEKIRVEQRDCWCFVFLISKKLVSIL